MQFLDFTTLGQQFFPTKITYTTHVRQVFFLHKHHIQHIL